MTYKKFGSNYVIRLEKGEELVKEVLDFCRDNKIKAGFMTGLGGLTSALVGYYNLNRKKYIFRNVKDAVELVSLNGNVAEVGGELALHMHAAVSDRRNKVHGGHLKEAEVGGTCEIYLMAFDGPMQRKMDEEIGLPLLDL